MAVFSKIDEKSLLTELSKLTELCNKSPTLQYGSLVRVLYNTFDPLTQVLGALDRWAGPLNTTFFNVPHHNWPRVWL